MYVKCPRCGAADSLRPFAPKESAAFKQPQEVKSKKISNYSGGGAADSHNPVAAKESSAAKLPQEVKTNIISDANVDSAAAPGISAHQKQKFDEHKDEAYGGIGSLTGIIDRNQAINWASQKVQDEVIQPRLRNYDLWIKCYRDSGQRILRQIELYKKRRELAFIYELDSLMRLRGNPPHLNVNDLQTIYTKSNDRIKGGE